MIDLLDLEIVVSHLRHSQHGFKRSPQIDVFSGDTYSIVKWYYDVILRNELRTYQIPHNQLIPFLVTFSATNKADRERNEGEENETQYRVRKIIEELGITEQKLDLESYKRDPEFI